MMPLLQLASTLLAGIAYCHCHYHRPCYGNGGDPDEGDGDEGDGNEGDGNWDYNFALESLYHPNVSIAFKSSYPISL